MSEPCCGGCGAPLVPYCLDCHDAEELQNRANHNDLAARIAALTEQRDQFKADCEVGFKAQRQQSNQILRLIEQRDKAIEQRNELRRACEAWAEVCTSEGDAVSFVAIVEKQVHAMNLTLAALANTEEA